MINLEMTTNHVFHSGMTIIICKTDVNNINLQLTIITAINRALTNSNIAVFRDIKHPNER